MKEKTRFGTNQEDMHALRCYDCGYEFDKILTINDKIYELNCPSCNKNTIEISFGRKVRE